MFLKRVQICPFKSVNTTQEVEIDKIVTVLVGMNEAGKTVFLQALHKSTDALGLAKFDPVEDYPRKDLPAYLKRHKDNPEAVTVLTYELNDEEVLQLNAKFHVRVPKGFQFSVTHLYDNSRRIGLDVSEEPAIQQLLKDAAITSDTKAVLETISTMREIPAALKDRSLTEEEKAFLAALNERITKAKENWTSVVAWEIGQWLDQIYPRCLYFSDYELLPSKVNLADLAARVEKANTDPNQLGAEHRAALALLRMADIEIADLTKSGGYETLKAKIEGVSISLTDQIMSFWKQNEDLEVEVDIKPDPEDITAPYNNGPNLYLRIKNRRHRGASTPFKQRSRGFIWFFSFLVWFDSVQEQLDATKTKGSSNLILLLDEPGLSLHALAQKDFLQYIDDLAEKHQVLYSTHSPFMIHSDQLGRVRLVEDVATTGTVITDTTKGRDPRTSFPLQAALGWTIAQNLFISERNLIVEGPSELIYLRVASSILEAKGKTGLREDVTLVPAGGLDKVVTFIALLGASGLKLAVLHDYRGAPEQKLVDLVTQKMISPKAVLNASQFRDLKNLGTSGPPSDVEDLFPPQMYLDYFSKTFKKELPNPLKDANLPQGDRIVDRITRHLENHQIQLRPKGGFNHYSVALQFTNNPPAFLDADTTGRFETLFKTVNSLFG